MSNQMSVCRRSNIEEEQRLIPSVNDGGKGPLSYFLRNIHYFFSFNQPFKKGLLSFQCEAGIKKKTNAKLVFNI